MVKRSLQVSAEGIKKAKAAFKNKGWTQEYLASEVGLETRQPIWKFFTGKPIDRHFFYEICFALEINPEEIMENSVYQNTESLDELETEADAIDKIIQKTRQKYSEKIQGQCGILHFLDVPRPIKLNDIYVDVNILEEINSQRWVEFNDLQASGVNYLGDNQTFHGSPEPIPSQLVIEKYAKLVVLGKPGSGKTTFLQFIALHCIQGFLLAHYLPIFISLKNFAEDTEHEKINLLHYINHEVSKYNSPSENDIIWEEGRYLLLLDGLDEVPQSEIDRVIKDIRYLSDNFYKNRIIITSRLATLNYNFRGFTEVEIANFSPSQISAFAEKWFLACTKNSQKAAKMQTVDFIQKLNLPENQQIKELAITPILLNLTCLVFHYLGDFPKQRSQLYHQGVELLLVRWDETRGIKRDNTYRHLSLANKLKLLSYLAHSTFQKSEYFFTINKLQQLISNFLETRLAITSQNTHELELDTFAIVKAIESQHGLLLEQARGIYTFSHLTFQEYFTAREIVNSQNIQTELVSHLWEKRWREIFLLAAEMLPSLNDLLRLMQLEIAQKIQSNEKLLIILNWIREKASSISIKSIYRQAAIRAFYFNLCLPPDNRLYRNQNLALLLDNRLANNLDVDLSLDLASIHALAVAMTIQSEIFHQRLSTLLLTLELDKLILDNPDYLAALHNLKHQLPSTDKNKSSLQLWWQNHGEDWINKLRNLMIEYRQIGYNWHLDSRDLEVITSYWESQQLLINCCGNISDDSASDILNQILFTAENNFC
ncbi:NACHT domain-containing protein [Calothrix sp. 336/3]|uniref:NACHT domain-containing protein n=1 Tax=Calothrix sp. 336/3 TaxID=1337936 RepID=UPI0004E3B3B1|nr:NACHT domain-containing NTPase [Calothrix sp. 336/3]AKG21902.1 hypothetical protein IJ00_12075 [Calothrix sp. 336/3]